MVLKKKSLSVSSLLLYTKKIYLVSIFLFLYLPMVILVLYSFNDSRSHIHWVRFTFKWYIELFHDRIILKSLYVTVSVAILSSIISSLIAIIAVMCIFISGALVKKIILRITELSIMMPDIIISISLMVLYVCIFSVFHLGHFGYVTLLLSHIAFVTPYIIFSVVPQINFFNVNTYEAALDLGATPCYAFVKIVLPEIMPGIITGTLFAFILSLDDFIISLFTSGLGVTNLSVLIYSMIRRGITPKINALSSIIFLLAIIMFYFSNRFSLLYNKHHKNNIQN